MGQSTVEFYGVDPFKGQPDRKKGVSINHFDVNSLSMTGKQSGQKLKEDSGYE
jgi:hypothetical protein